MPSPIFLYLTIGAGGARGDFIAGWLSSLPWLINNEWNIDPLTGRSFGAQQLARNLDHISKNCVSDNDLNNFLSSQNWYLDSSAKWGYSGAIHGFNIGSQITRDNLSATKFIVVDTSDVDPAILHWEFCVKTYGSFDNRRHTLENNEPNYHIDYWVPHLPVTDQDRCNYFKQQLLGTKTINSWRPDINFPHVTIKYSDVVSPTGSKKLTELLNIDVDPLYHALWEKNLQLAQTPESINLFGQQWSKSMCS